MGASTSWIALRNTPVDAICGVLPISRMPAARASDSDGVQACTVGEWTVLELARAEHPFLDPKHLERLSKATDVVAGWVETHVMASFASGWKDGRQIWSVAHNSDDDTRHLAVVGVPPPEFAGIRHSLESQQDEADSQDEATDFFFNIPIDLTLALTGFSYEESPPEDAFVNLEWKGKAPFEAEINRAVEKAMQAFNPKRDIIKSGKKPWYKRLFGG